jgi:cysteine desulfurase/selenocysteine lyase
MPVNDMNEALVEQWRSDFPILQQSMNGQSLIYLDNAATTQKPQVVIDALVNHYTHYNANVHRGVYALSQIATDHYEHTRKVIAKFLNASSEKEIIFTKGATEAINLVAASFGELAFSEGDEIILTLMEHHANIIPWQEIANKKGCVIKVVPIEMNGTLDIDAYSSFFSERTKFVSMVWISNAIGVENPIEQFIKIAHSHNVPILIDASQAVQHKKIDVQALDCDFLVFSGHKVYGPSGTGILYGKSSLLDAMPPYQTGGDMIRKVTFEKTTFAELPSKFEAGTPNIEGFIGLGVAIEYLQSKDIDLIAKHERELLHHAVKLLETKEFINVIGYNRTNVSALSFMIDGVHPHDIASLLDRKGIAVRAGHHCAHPLMQFYGVNSTTRMSFAMYTTKHEIEQCIDALDQIFTMFNQ